MWIYVLSTLKNIGRNILYVHSRRCVLEIYTLSIVMVGENVIDMVRHHFCVEKCEKKSVLQKSYLTLWHYSFAMADYVLVV